MIAIVALALFGWIANMFLGLTPEVSNYSLTVENEATENLDVGNYASIENATTTVTYDMSAADNISVTLNSEVVVDQEITGSGTIENDVKSYINEGNNELAVSLDNGTSNVNSLTTALDVNANTDTLGVIGTVKDWGPDIIKMVVAAIIALVMAYVLNIFDRV
jgi:hypothetical protein